MTSPDTSDEIDKDVSEFMATTDAVRPDKPTVLKTKEWMDSDPEGMLVMVTDKLSELYHDRYAIQQRTIATKMESFRHPRNERWIYELQNEYDQENLAGIQKQITRFKWMENYLNPANKITDDDIEQARRVSLDSFLPALKPAGSGKMKCCCPFHEERTASFVVYTEDNRYHCYGCNAHGSVIDYLMEKDKLTFLEAVKSLIGK